MYGTSRAHRLPAIPYTGIFEYHSILRSTSFLELRNSPPATRIRSPLFSPMMRWIFLIFASRQSVCGYELCHTTYAPALLGKLGWQIADHLQFHSGLVQADLRGLFLCNCGSVLHIALTIILTSLHRSDGALLPAPALPAFYLAPSPAAAPASTCGGNVCSLQH